MPRRKPSDSLSNCPVCGAALVLPVGPPDARAIIVSDRPDEWELRYGHPFVPQAPAGSILHHELIRAGLSIDEFRVTNVWLHEPNDLCLDWHVQQVLNEIVKRDALLVLGSIACHHLLEKSVMSVSGLVYRAKIRPKLTVAGPNPAEALHGGIGELRLSLSRFAAAYHKLK